MTGPVIEYAARSHTVLVSGGTPAMRRTVARRIHLANGGAALPFVSAAETPLCEVPRRGTLFWDEIGCLGPAAQASLMEWLDRQPNGGPCLRLISGTGMNLFELVRSQRFDDRLFYRLNVFHIRLLAPARRAARRSDGRRAAAG